MTDQIAFVARENPAGTETFGIALKKDAAKEFANILVPSLLFGLLAPGGILHIPAPEKGPYKGQIFTPGMTDWRAIAVHTLVFALILFLLRTIFPQWF